ncbi:MAG TPA: adenosylcobalamin-dependent ribonucleoside-diphosphate reductase [Candidatus Brocadiia bacterium]|nr:adenosylcobalamin-dependent ribonucleoside-diphosphate reductase [Candidatus Brocadiia bacterium]
MAISLIRKRDGRSEPFDAGRIERAIAAAERALGRQTPSRAAELAREVVARLEAAGGEPPTVERVQDVVESTLIDAKDTELAKAYILYRRAHTEMRLAKAALGVHDDLKLTLNAIRVLERRYLRKDSDGQVVETPTEMFRRVAKAAAQAEAGIGAAGRREDEFFALMSSLDFLPNSPTLMNAGTPMAQLSACFVLPVPDSLEGIFETLKNMAVIHQSGGGTGFNFSRLRPRGAVVRSTGGAASGPVSFMEVFDKATEVIRQAGRRRGANMAILDATHPDCLDFVRSKEGLDRLTNFNISVGVTDAFMRAAREGAMYDLLDPRSGEPVGRRNAADMLAAIAEAAWQCGDPGLVFLDAIERGNPVPGLGRITATNPCGEQPLLDYESCNLGSLNLPRFVKDGGLDEERLGKAVDTAVRFLDNIIEVNRFPIEKIGEATRRTRKIGLGVMGFADMLYRLDIAYNSEAAVELAGRVMAFITQRARQASARLAEERGSFPAIGESVWPGRGWPRLRNATVTTVAPTGTISLIAGVSSGIEPVFALRSWRTMAEGARLVETHPEYLRRARMAGWSEEKALSMCGADGSLQRCADAPEPLRRTLVVARDIGVEWHIRIQVAFQRHVDNGVSKTVNLPASATVETVRRAFLLAHEMGCKGVTVYREGCRQADLLNAGDVDGAACNGKSGRTGCN